jgi:hypothetical protein
LFDAHLHRGRHSRLLVLALLAVLLTGSLTPATAAPAPPAPAPAVAGGPQEPIGTCTLSFTDLPIDSPFYSFVQTLVCRSIVGGYSDNTFRPGANVTRGQLAKFVSNAAGYQDAIPATQQTFRDVPPDNPFWLFIERVHAHNVVGGYADGSFQPGNNVTRGQIAKFVSNAAVLTDTIPATQQTFADVPAANPFWLYIERAAQAGVVGGYSDGTFRPTNNVTRGQTAKFIANGFFPASAQELIAAAYQAGQIDYPTSLLYRAYALFSDARLPASYQGVGSTGDVTLFREIAASRATLPASVLAQLQPFLVRPDDPTSILNTPGAKAPRSAQGTAAALACSSTGWANQASANPQHHVKVWARCNRPEDAGYDVAISTTLGILDQVWDPMTGLMGAPLDDGYGGGSAAIDFYVVGLPDRVYRNRGGWSLTDAKDADGLTMPTSETAVRSSAFVLLSRAKVTQPLYHSLVVHEFFHVLQDAHNALVWSRNSGTAAAPVWDAFWFMEASATWAETYYDRTIPWPQRAAGTYTYPWFRDFQQNLAELHASTPPDHMYGAFIWPFFMEQETGGPALIADAWRAFEPLGAGDFAGAMAALDRTFAFDTHFADFAVRNLNSEFDGQDPIRTHYRDRDSLFPEGVMPRPNEQDAFVWPMDPAYPGKEIAATIAPLQAAYYHYAVLSGIKQIRLNFAQLAPAAHLKARALVRVRGENGAPSQWGLRDLSTTSENVLCDVDEIWIVLSNTSFSYDASQTIRSSFRVRALAAPCTCDEALLVRSGWAGTYGLTWNDTASRTVTGGMEQAHVQHLANLQLRLSDWNPDPMTQDPRWEAWVLSNNISGDAHVNDTDTWTMNGNATTYSNIGHGPPDFLTFARLTLRAATCTYDLQIMVSTATTRMPGGNEEHALLGLLNLTGLPLPVDGAEQRLQDYRNVHATLTGSDFQVGATAGVTGLERIKGPDGMNDATVTWDFTPITPAAAQR